MIRRAVYPGSFDPVTLGHIDIIDRASEIVDELIVGVLINKGKNPLFSVDERVNMLQIVTRDMPNVTVQSFDGLLVDFLKLRDAEFVIRGLRAITDFEYELQMAQTNRIMSPNTDTIFLTTNLKYAYLNSTTVREVASYGGDISKFVPDFIAQAVYDKYR